MRIRVRDAEYVLLPGNIPMEIKDRFELETGRSVEYVVQTRQAVGELQVALMCYLAVMISGDRSRWTRFRDQWPDDLTAEDITVEVDDGDPGSGHPES